MVDLRAWREQHDYSQQRLADALGVSPRTVLRWENGQVAVPPYLPLALVGLEQQPAPEREPAVRAVPRMRIDPREPIPYQVNAVPTLRSVRSVRSEAPEDGARP